LNVEKNLKKCLIIQGCIRDRHHPAHPFKNLKLREIGVFYRYFFGFYQIFTTKALSGGPNNSIQRRFTSSSVRLISARKTLSLAA
jgi:hypothetical protein